MIAHYALLLSLVIISISAAEKKEKIFTINDHTPIKELKCSDVDAQINGAIGGLNCSVYFKKGIVCSYFTQGFLTKKTIFWDPNNQKPVEPLCEGLATAVDPLYSQAVIVEDESTFGLFDLEKKQFVGKKIKLKDPDRAQLTPSPYENLAMVRKDLYCQKISTEIETQQKSFYALCDPRVNSDTYVCALEDVVDFNDSYIVQRSSEDIQVLDRKKIPSDSGVVFGSTALKQFLVARYTPKDFTDMVSLYYEKNKLYDPAIDCQARSKLNRVCLIDDTTIGYDTIMIFATNADNLQKTKFYYARGTRNFDKNKKGSDQIEYLDMSDPQPEFSQWCNVSQAVNNQITAYWLDTKMHTALWDLESKHCLATATTDYMVEREGQIHLQKLILSDDKKKLFVCNDKKGSLIKLFDYSE